MDLFNKMRISDSTIIANSIKSISNPKNFYLGVNKESKIRKIIKLHFPECQNIDAIVEELLNDKWNESDSEYDDLE